MSEQLWVLLEEPFDGEHTKALWVVDSGDGMFSAHEQGELVDILGSELPVNVILPAEAVLRVRVEVNPGQRKHLQQALPFLVEEQLAQDIEQQHVAAGIIEGDRVDVAVIGEKQIAELYALAEAYNTPLAHCYSELDGLPFATDQVHCWQHEDRMLVSQATGDRVVLEGDAFELMLPHLIPDEVGCTVCVRLKSLPNEHLEALVAANGASYEAERVNERWLSQLVNGIKESHYAVDLLQGAFPSRSNQSQGLRRWRPVALVAGIWLGCELLLGAGQAAWFSYQSSRYQSEAVEIYKQVYPNATHIFNARDQMTAQMNQGRQSDSESGLLVLLNSLASAPVSFSSASIVPQSINYNDRDKRLDIQATAPDYEQVNKFLGGLRQVGLRGELESAVQNKGTLVARISVKG